MPGNEDIRGSQQDTMQGWHLRGICNPDYRPGTASSHWRLESQRERDSLILSSCCYLGAPVAVLLLVLADGNTPGPAEAPPRQPGTLWEQSGLQGPHPHLRGPSPGTALPLALISKS